MKTKIADISQVEEGKTVCVKAEGVKLVLTKLKGQILAFENKCPHLGLPLGKGKVENGQIVCPFHGSRFDMKTGENTDWVSSFAGIPLPGWSRGMVAMGKKPQGIKTYKVEIETTEIFVNL